ncbi:peptidoglycan-binding protein [Peribacillus sp. NPDC060186]
MIIIIEAALRKYQEFHNLPQSGELDESTVKQMKLPRWIRFT